MPLSPHFSLRVTPSEEVEIIISISKKVSKSAVVRNRIRRRVRPILRELIPKHPALTYLFVAKLGVEKVKGAELESELRSLVVSR